MATYAPQAPAAAITQAAYDDLEFKLENLKTSAVAFLNELKTHGADAKGISTAITSFETGTAQAAYSLKRLHSAIIKPVVLQAAATDSAAPTA